MVACTCRMYVLCLHTSCVRALSPDSVSSLMGVERWDTAPSSSRSSSESSSDVLLMASSLGGGGALAAVFLWSSVSSLLLLLLPVFRDRQKYMRQLNIGNNRFMTRKVTWTGLYKLCVPWTYPSTDFPVSSGLRTVNGLGSTPNVLGMNSLHENRSEGNTS